MVNFCLESFMLGFGCAFVLLCIVALIWLFVEYQRSKYLIICYILKNKNKYEPYYFRIDSYNSAKSIYKIISESEKNFICQRLDISSFWGKCEK